MTAGWPDQSLHPGGAVAGRGAKAVVPRRRLRNPRRDAPLEGAPPPPPPRPNKKKEKKPRHHRHRHPRAPRLHPRPLLNRQLRLQHRPRDSIPRLHQETPRLPRPLTLTLTPRPPPRRRRKEVERQLHQPRRRRPQAPPHEAEPKAGPRVAGEEGSLPLGGGVAAAVVAAAERRSRPAVAAAGGAEHPAVGGGGGVAAGAAAELRAGGGVISSRGEGASVALVAGQVGLGLGVGVGG